MFTVNKFTVEDSFANELKASEEAVEYDGFITSDDVITLFSELNLSLKNSDDIDEIQKAFIEFDNPPKALIIYYDCGDTDVSYRVNYTGNINDTAVIFYTENQYYNLFDMTIMSLQEMLQILPLNAALEKVNRAKTIIPSVLLLLGSAVGIFFCIKWFFGS
ncbi:MAG: hypothetical protein LBR74_04235 [Eubacterium sp.]|jgi:hypothetical protein|nr:hypothetical protein [Eubacterium sp.]